ncbi:MAG TPA: nuclear transport factor 2 family protein [Caulobacterales bacterium]|nr:nuclear transport factor 2 family protein [Caulobacterales bacterium]
MTPVEVVQGQFDAYNAQDLERFMTFYAPNAVLASFNGDVLAEGAEAVRARHANLFSTYPNNRARLVNRIAFANTVIDHEDVERVPGGERFEVAAIYTLKNGLIARVDFAK